MLVYMLEFVLAFALELAPGSVLVLEFVFV